MIFGALPFYNFQFHQGLSSIGVSDITLRSNLLSIPSRIIVSVYLNRDMTEIIEAFNSIKDYLVHVQK